MVFVETATQNGSLITRGVGRCLKGQGQIFKNAIRLDIGGNFQFRLRLKKKMCKVGGGGGK